MSNFKKYLVKIFSRTNEVKYEISEKGVLRVNATHLLKTEPAKRQIEAVKRLQRGNTTSRQHKVA